LRAIVLGGVSSGVGKTTIAAGLMGALARRGLKVQPFKTGPDYIDTTYHSWATGSPSRNLDTWMLPHGAVQELFGRAMAGKDIGVVEGVMGLFDGHSPTSDEGSTAELVKLLKLPVVLIVDGRNAARSVAATVKGFQTFDASLKLGGVILNGLGSEGHFAICRDAIEHYDGIRVLGYLPRRKDLVLPERHLGLVPTVEGPAGEEFLDALIRQCEASIDIDGVIDLAAQADPPLSSPVLFPGEYLNPEVRIAVARDRAFSFYYQDSLDLLESRGAELVPFSPLSDAALPDGLGGLYIGGGFPEMYAAELAGNESMKRSIRSAAEGGMPVYGECGGLMYLGTNVRDLQGKDHGMAGVMPLDSRMDKARLTLGYRTVRALRDGPLLRQGETVRGHEFHWSNLEGSGGLDPAYSVLESGGRLEGFQRGSVIASYVHLHMAALPSMARRFVEVCRAWKER
jgi:cobyrinic acid a,c-diamide synthase